MVLKSKEWENIIGKKLVKITSGQDVDWIFELLGWKQNARRSN